MTCDARILVWTAWIAQDGLAGIADCEREEDHGGFHRGPLDHEIYRPAGGPPRPVFSWEESDRRTFRGELRMCGWHPPFQDIEGSGRCTLPLHHRGAHAP